MSHSPDLAHSIKSANGRGFAKELQELQQKARIVDIFRNDGVIKALHLSLTDPIVLAKELRELGWKAQILDILSSDHYSRDLSLRIPDPKLKALAAKLEDVRGKAQAFDVVAGKDYSSDASDLNAEPNPNLDRLGEELAELREKAKMAEMLMEENKHLRMDLENALRKPKDALTTTDDINYQEQNSDQRALTAAEKKGKDGLHKGSDDYSALRIRFEILSRAHTMLQARCRKIREHSQQWWGYAKSLEKRLEKNQAILADHGLLNREPFQAKHSVMERPTSAEPDVAEKASDNDQLHDTSKLPSLPRRRLKSSPIPPVTDLDGDTMVGTPRSTNPKITISIHKPVQQNDGPEIRLDLMYPTTEQDDTRDHGKVAAPLPLPQNVAVQPEQSPQLPRYSKSQLVRTASIPDSTDPASSPSQQHTSSTQGDPDDILVDSRIQQAITTSTVTAVENSSDAPVVVSARVIRKRKVTESPKKIRIKKEHDSSSPIAFLSMRHLEPHESMDLDEIGPKTATPKKVRHPAIPIYSNEMETNDYHYQHAPVFHTTAAKTGISYHPTTPQVRTPSARGNVSALQPKSINKKILPRTTIKYPSAKRQRLEDRVRGAALLSEDGENSPAVSAASVIRKRQQRRPDVAQRLASLLDEPPSRSSKWDSGGIVTLADVDDMGDIAPDDRLQRMLLAKRTSLTSANQRHKRGLPSDDSSRLNKSNSKRNVAQKKIPDSPSSSEEDSEDEYAEELDPAPEDEPFRARHLRRLGLEHFKVNPAYNQGYDYAFRDVVRGREKRKCLPGCTKAECCGKAFRKLAEMTKGDMENQTSSQAEEDNRLLQDYLGANSGKLQNMCKEERKETLIQAKTWELSNKHGKHRHAFERRQSPPGFWRTDFPTTQEVEADRKEAAKVERELVKKRYEEAMREGGRWMFRDE